MSSNVPGNILGSPLDEINSSSNFSIFTYKRSLSEPVDNYKLNLNSRSSLNIKLNGLSADADLQLIEDRNGNNVVDDGEIIASSRAPRTGREFINAELSTGNYYIQVISYNNAQTNYQLEVKISPVSEVSSSIPLAASGRSGRASRGDAWRGGKNTNNTSSAASASTSPWQKGTLGADRFTYEVTTAQTIFSGNGNVDFGNSFESRDTLSFKEAGILSTQASFNWATAAVGGVVANPGNEYRVFDALTINGINAGQILFEGIEKIEFTDITYDLTTVAVGGRNATVITNDKFYIDDPNNPGQKIEKGFFQQDNLHMTGVHNAWRFTTGNSNIRIGIADSGLASDANGNTHPDLRSTNDSANNIADESVKDSHGTQVQSIIEAQANNGIGIAGVNWGSEVDQIDVLGEDPGDYDLAGAAQTIIDNAAKQGQKAIINFSLEGGDTQAFRQVIANNSTNALFVISAGNGNKEQISSPAVWAEDFDNVISVGASWGRTDGNGRNLGDRVYYDNWWGSNYTTQEKIKITINGDGKQEQKQPLTIMAPTELPAANSVRDSNGIFKHGYDDKFNGTSASAAMVSGIASLVWSANSNLGADQIKKIISDTAYDLGEPGYDRFYGHGFINADAAVRRALAFARSST